MSLSRGLQDTQYMQHALRLGARGLGQTWPNPSVGALIVKDGTVVGRGTTAKGGRPHAETVALDAAGEAAKGATLYVSLEPCAHQGKTAPCTEAIIRAGIARVVAACTDPNPQVSGKGFAQLRAAGLEVTEGVCEAQARALNEGFFSAIKRKRPFVTLKIAASLDGKIAGGKSRWLTNDASRARGHWLRATHDAILTGIGTVLADDPQMTCRLPGRGEDSPQRVVLDSKLRIPQGAKILPAWIFTGSAAFKNTKKVRALEAKDASVFAVKTKATALSLPAVLAALAGKGVTRLLVEGGSKLTTAFLREGLADRIYWFRAPMLIGEKGLSVFEGRDLPPYTLRESEALEGDVLEMYDCPA